MQAYRIIQPRVVYEVLTNEVIAIDFNTGTYFALLHAAKHVWILIEKLLPVDKIAAMIASHYKQELPKVREDVRAFLDELVAAELIELSNEAPQNGTVQLESLGWEYAPPKLMTYKDVQDLLLLDPIHEVAEAGWPNKL